jgi:hypothetical protein
MQPHAKRTRVTSVNGIVHDLPVMMMAGCARRAVRIVRARGR